MKRVSIILVVILLCTLPGKAQFWISFGWNESHCQNCLWMEQAIRMNNRQAADYHKIIHKYGQKIEKEARKHYRYWDQSARAIYNLRMERDRKLQHVLSPSQFRLYVRFVRETPTRIHDYQGWFNNPHHPSYRPTDVCFRYEDHYWHSQWEYANDRWHDRFDDHGWYRGKFDHPRHNHGQVHPGHNDRPHFDNDRPNHNNGRPHYNERDNSNRDKFDRDHNDKKDKDRNQRYERSKRSNKDKKDNKDSRDRKDRDDRTNRSDQTSKRTRSI